MKATGKEWNAFLASWPEGQWMEETDIYVNGEEEEEVIPDDARVEVFAGTVFRNDDDRDGKSLVGLFNKWKKAQRETSFLVTCDTEKHAAVIAAIKAAGGRVN